MNEIECEECGEEEDLCICNTPYSIGTLGKRLDQSIALIPTKQNPYGIEK